MKIALGIRLGKAEQRALRFTCKVDGWTGFSTDAKREIVSLERKGLVHVIAQSQKYCATKEGKAIFPEGVNVAQMTMTEMSHEYDSIIDVFDDYVSSGTHHARLFDGSWNFPTMAAIFPEHYSRMQALREEFQRRKAQGVV